MKIFRNTDEGREPDFTYDKRSRMRLGEARRVIRYAAEVGVGLDQRDESEWDAAWFRIMGLDALDKPPQLAVKNELTAPAAVPGWEKELLRPVVQEFFRDFDQRRNDE
jgi:hypothetical protein